MWNDWFHVFKRFQKKHLVNDIRRRETDRLKSEMKKRSVILVGGGLLSWLFYSNGMVKDLEVRFPHPIPLKEAMKRIDLGFKDLFEGVKDDST